MSYVLETGVEMPSKRNRYPFDQMSSGDSFEIHGTEESRKVRNAAYQYARKVNTEKKLEKGQDGWVAFALRKVDELGEGETAVKVYRLWRE
jgi:translation elongation factor EF-4